MVDQQEPREFAAMREWAPRSRGDSSGRGSYDHFMSDLLAYADSVRSESADTVAQLRGALVDLIHVVKDSPLFGREGYDRDDVMAYMEDALTVLEGESSPAPLPQEEAK